MSERISILNEIKSGGYEASLITTFNAYLPFYEDVVLRHLMGGGIRHNVLMMDASQATLAFERHPPQSAGRFYTLAPISVAGAFHPKVVFLVGKKKGTLLVGSHNLTLSGFGYNREMTNVILCKGEDDTEGVALLNSAWQFILDWAESQSEILPAHIIDMVKKIQDFTPWLQKKAVGTLPENCRVLSAGSKSQALWQQLTEFVGEGPVQRVTVNGAFFDSNLSFIEKVRDELSPEELIVGIDPATVQFPVDKKLAGVSFVNCSSLGLAEKDDNHGYLHAKSIVIEREDGETVLAVGSANPSYPAWLAPKMSQNVEIMVARKGADATEAAKDLGLTDISSMPRIEESDWQEIRKNWEREEQSEQTTAVAQIIIALASESDIRFRLPNEKVHQNIECEIVAIGLAITVKRRAYLKDSEYVIITDALPTQTSFIRFNLQERQYTGLVQYVKQIEGLSRTSSQRRFNDALSSLATGMPNLEHFVDCIKEIIKISDNVAVIKSTTATSTQNKGNEKSIIQQEGAELSIGLDEVVEQEHQRKQRLRGSDDLGYLLDVLLYNLRDGSPVMLEDALESRDALGRSEEEQVDADDEEVPPLPVKAVNNQDTPQPRSPLKVCHDKVSTLVGMACDKLDALKQGQLELAHFVVVMAGILSALRLLRGLDGKVPWVGTGQTAVPKKELRKLFQKIADVSYDGPKSIICLDSNSVNLTDFDEFARLKGLIIWLAWDSGIVFADKKPFNESAEERTERFDANRLYVATAQMIAGDEETISEARQSIGQFSSIDTVWLEKLLAVDQFFLSVIREPGRLPDGTTAKTGDFGFNMLNRTVGIREILPTGGSDLGLAGFSSNHRKYKIPAINIRTVTFAEILHGSTKRYNQITTPS